jgi:zinc transporter ZupT
MSPMITCLTIATVAVGVNAAVSSPTGFFTSNTTLTDPMFSASVKEDSDYEFNTMLGFILVAAGSLVPALGALLLYMEDVIKLFPSVSPDFTITNNPKFLASILSFSVGVLICSIFLALIPEAIIGFETSVWLEGLESERLNKIIGSCIFALFVAGLLVKRVWFGGGHSHNHGCPDLNAKDEKSVVSERNQVASAAIASDIEGQIEVTVLDKELSVHTSITNNGSVLPKSPEEEQMQFKSMANRIMIAFFIHNIPEGLVTFLSVYESYKNGIIFTIALSLHKLPEGIMISVPVYYGYKKKWKAIVACLVCTLIPQLVGSLIAWASTRLAYDSLITGIMFLIATTILSETTFGEVIPMARSYDPKDLYTTNWILIGIVVFLFLKTAVE